MSPLPLVPSSSSISLFFFFSLGYPVGRLAAQSSLRVGICTGWFRHQMFFRLRPSMCGLCLSTPACGFTWCEAVAVDLHTFPFIPLHFVQSPLFSHSLCISCAKNVFEQMTLKNGPGSPLNELFLAPFWNIGYFGLVLGFLSYFSDFKLIWLF